MELKREKLTGCKLQTFFIIYRAFIHIYDFYLLGGKEEEKFCCL